jgi:uncharacterized protein YcfJ
MNKLTTLLTAALITSSAQAFEYEYILRDGSLGAIAGAVIGNNVGDGDSETGAIIGGVVGAVAGEYGRRGNQRKNTNSQSVTIVKQAPQVQAHQQQVQVKEQVWVADEYVTDVSGNVLYNIPGHYETRVVTKTITVYR